MAPPPPPPPSIIGDFLGTEICRPTPGAGFRGNMSSAEADRLKAYIDARIAELRLLIDLWEGVEEAPNDGRFYTRGLKAWHEVALDGGYF